jgi:hypothetical protein
MGMRWDKDDDQIIIDTAFDIAAEGCFGRAILLLVAVGGGIFTLFTTVF